MPDPFTFLVNNAIREAEADGAFENLSGAGKPIADLHQPQDAMLHRIMQEARAVPPVVTLKQQIVASRDRLKHLTDPADRKSEMRTLADLQTRLAIEQEAWNRYG